MAAHPLGVELVRVDPSAHHPQPLRRHGVLPGQTLGQEVRDRDQAVGTATPRRFICIVHGGDERDRGGAGRGGAARRRQRSMGMDQGHAMRTDDAGQPAAVAPGGEAASRVERQRQVGPTGGRQLAFQLATGRGHQRPPAPRPQVAGEVHRVPADPVAVELGRQLQHRGGQARVLPPGAHPDACLAAGAGRVCLHTFSKPPGEASRTHASMQMDQGKLNRKDAPALAFHRTSGRMPTVVFLTGFRSDMTGAKALISSSIAPGTPSSLRLSRHGPRPLRGGLRRRLARRCIGHAGRGGAGVRRTGRLQHGRLAHAARDAGAARAHVRPGRSSAFRARSDRRAPDTQRSKPSEASEPRPTNLPLDPARAKDVMPAARAQRQMHDR